MTVRMNAEFYMEVCVRLDSHLLAREGAVIRRGDLIRQAHALIGLANSGAIAPDLMVRGDLYGPPENQMTAEDLAA